MGSSKKKKTAEKKERKRERKRERELCVREREQFHATVGKRKRKGGGEATTLRERRGVSKQSGRRTRTKGRR